METPTSPLFALHAQSTVNPADHFYLCFFETEAEMLAQYDLRKKVGRTKEIINSDIYIIHCAMYYPEALPAPAPEASPKYEFHHAYFEGETLFFQVIDAEGVKRSRILPEELGLPPVSKTNEELIQEFQQAEIDYKQVLRAYKGNVPETVKKPKVGLLGTYTSEEKANELTSLAKMAGLRAFYEPAKGKDYGSIFYILDMQKDKYV